MELAQVIRCFWFSSNNVGDALNVYLVRAIRGECPALVEAADPASKYVVCGSILAHARAPSVVWGAGIGAMAETVEPGLDLRAVRGPLTRWRALKAGVACPEVYGDPALLLPRFYRPKPLPRSSIGLAPHYVDQERAVELYGSAPEVRIVNMLGDVETTIDAIASCDAVVATSLHGVILAAAYGVPVRWAEISDRIHGDGTKFFDFYLSGGNAIEVPLDLRSTAVLAAELANGARVLGLPDVDALWRACPFRPEP